MSDTIDEFLDAETITQQPWFIMASGRLLAILTELSTNPNPERTEILETSQELLRAHIERNAKPLFLGRSKAMSDLVVLMIKNQVEEGDNDE